MTKNNYPTIGFGLIGVGMIADYHAQAIKGLASTHNIRLVGVTGSSQTRNQDFALRHDVPFHTTHIDTLLARDDIQVVCIATPSGAHLEPALKAIAAGKHIIVEKPLEITLERADAMIAAAKIAGSKICAISQARFTPGAQALKNAIEHGRFGRLALCSAYVKWHRTAAYYQGWKGTLALDGGGAVINQAIHALDLLTWLAGVPTEVFARTTRCVHLGIEAEDTACANFKFANGALGVLEATTAAYPGWERRIEICGEFGSAAIEDDRIVRWDFMTPQPEDDALRSLSISVGASGAGSPTDINFLGHQLHIAEMVSAIRTGSPLTIEAHEARNTVACVRAIYDSAHLNSPVTVAVK
ncbi:oxidoreductase [Cellvibrio zantedeschiae]|uniref:Oxidoreductase n=1 Tax=Cellvibrio zantedeschiae TaxID=1237077 RepID=A0ABQ3AWM9_9GAMM|nr:Gfo/Idh/MocA family oxidoreductase [Cellvibrio zantedeschiae]GGY67555.1 oxidoreductase [Cellvibrio zantedeschiae]